jgi:hypothetical protein
VKYCKPLIAMLSAAAIAVAVPLYAPCDSPSDVPVTITATVVTPAAIPSIDGPDQVDPGKPAWYRVTGVPDGASVAFLPTPLLDTSPGRIVQGNAMFWVGSPGEYTITALVVDWSAHTFVPVTKQITVPGEGPQPNPTPTPQPTPNPVPAGTRLVLILSESADRTPAEAAVQEALRRHLESLPEPPLFRILDPDTPTQGNWGKPYKAEIERRKLALPVLVVSVLPDQVNRLDALYFVSVEELPAEADKAIALVQEALK